LQVFSQPTHPEPGRLVVPPEYTAGPGAMYWLRAPWILTPMPGSLALYAPGNFTVGGRALPPPAPLIW
jgi:hypothetical protein